METPGRSPLTNPYLYDRVEAVGKELGFSKETLPDGVSYDGLARGAAFMVYICDKDLPESYKSLEIDQLDDAAYAFARRRVDARIAYDEIIALATGSEGTAPDVYPPAGEEA